MQAAGKNTLDSSTNEGVMSESIWSSLRMVLHLMDKGHLAKHVDSRFILQKKNNIFYYKFFYFAANKKYVLFQRLVFLQCGIERNDVNSLSKETIPLK